MGGSPCEEAPCTAWTNNLAQPPQSSFLPSARYTLPGVIMTCGSEARIHATARSMSAVVMTAQEQMTIAAIPGYSDFFTQIMPARARRNPFLSVAVEKNR